MIKDLYGVTVVVGDPMKIKQDSEAWRIDISFYSTRPIEAKVKQDYELWATEEFIEDTLHLKKSPGIHQMKRFAFEFIRDRFEKSGKRVPDEYGAFCSNSTGVKLVDHSGTLVSHFENWHSAHDTPSKPLRE